MTQLKHTLCLGLLSVTLGLAVEPARAADQTVPGAGNTTAIALSTKSPMVQSAKEFLLERIKKIDNATTRAITQDAIANPTTCVAHRAGLTEGQKDAILQELVAAGLLDTRDDATFPNGLKAGVFRVCVATGSCGHISSPGILPTTICWAQRPRKFGCHTDSYFPPFRGRQRLPEVTSDLFLGAGKLFWRPPFLSRGLAGSRVL